MGTETIPNRADNTTIFAEHLNILKRSLAGDMVPRNSNGEAEDESGSLGTATLEYLRAFIASGYWSPGDIKSHHSFNGTVGPGHGWMLCDGRQISEANYNTEHGAGSWTKYVSTSPLDGLYLPNLTDKYLRGKAATTQDGTNPLNFSGNSNNQVNLQHSHTVNSHNHSTPAHQHGITGNGVKISDWYHKSGNNWATTNSGLFDTQFNSNATSSSSITGILVGTGAAAAHSGISGVFNPSGSQYAVLNSLQIGTTPSGAGTSGNSSPGTNNQLSSAQDISPHSLDVLFYMRVI